MGPSQAFEVPHALSYSIWLLLRPLRDLGGGPFGESQEKRRSQEKPREEELGQLVPGSVGRDTMGGSWHLGFTHWSPMLSVCGAPPWTLKGHIDWGTSGNMI